MSSSWKVFLPPLVWAIFVWVWVVVFSQGAHGTFYALVRGTGAIHYSSAVVVGSGALDLALLAVAALALLAVHIILGQGKVTSPVPGVAAAGCGIALAGTLATGSFAFFLGLGLFAACVAAWDAVRAPGLSGTPAGEWLALSVLNVLAVGALLAVAADARWLLGGFDGSTPLKDPSWNLPFAGLQGLGLLDPVVGYLALVFLFTWAIRLGLPSILHRLKLARETKPSGPISPSTDGRDHKRVAMVALSAAIVTSVFVGIYPYLPAVNTHTLLVGVDVRYCYSGALANNYTSGVCGNSTAQVVLYRFGAFEMLRGLAAITGSTRTALIIAPALLGALLVVSTFVLALEGTKDWLVAGVSALFGATSPELISGINAGILANWLAISLTFLFFAAIIHALRTRDGRFMVLGAFISVLVLLVHPWTWAVGLVVTGAFLFLTLLESSSGGRLRSARIEILALVGIVAVVLAADAALTFFVGRSGIEIAASALPTLSLPTFTSIQVNLKETFVMWLLGGFANPIWFILGAVGFLSIASLKEDFGKLLGTWLGAISVGVLLIGDSGDPTLMSRFLYMLPIPVLAGMGFVAIYRMLAPNLSGRGLRSLLLLLAVLAIIGVSLGFTLDNVGYLYRGVPGT